MSFLQSTDSDDRDSPLASPTKKSSRVVIGLDGTPQSPIPKSVFIDTKNLGPKGENPRVKMVSYLIRLVEKFPQYVREVSDFQYDRLIGKGGFGEVWMGNDLRTGKIVAIKELYAHKLVGKALSSFCREINTICRVKSRFVVPFVGFTIEPPYSIITEYMPNGSLFYYTNRTQRSFEMSGTHLSIIAMCIAHGMSSIRAARIVHRDLKGANILLDDNRLPMICDFGVARFETKEGRKTPKVGTYSHMAPEVMTSDDYSYDSDKYSYGMLLYEMAESRNPFGNVKKPRELLHMVPKGASPPLYQTDTPEPLVQLMKDLWDRNPKRRPTWTQIFHMWANGDVYFKGTDVNAVREFSKPLVKTLGENGKRTEPMEPVIDVESTMKRLSRRLKRALDTVDAFGNDLISDSEDENWENWDNELPAAASPGSGQTDRGALLRDPSNPDFDRALESFAQVITPKQFQALYLAVRGYIKDAQANEIAARKCILAFTKLAQRDKDFLKAMSRVHLFTLLPLTTPLLVDASFELVAQLILKEPELLDQSLKRALGTFIVQRPVDAAQLFAVYVSHYDSLSDPQPTIELFLAYARAFLDNPGGATIVQSLLFLMDRHEKFATTMIDVIGPIFSAYCRSKCVPTVYQAVVGLIRIADTNVTIPFDALCRNVSSRELYRVTLSLFLRIRKFPVSRTICKVLAEKALTYPRAFEALWCFADQQVETATIVAKSTKWMNSNSADAFTLLLVVFKHEQLRNVIATSPMFGSFLARMAATEDKQVLVAIPSVLRRISLNQEIIDNLTEGTFFKRFYASVKKLSDPAVMAACNTLLDHVSRSGATNDFALFLPMLGKMLSLRNELATSAIYVFTSFSYHRFLAAKLQNPELTNYFKALEKVPNFAKFAQIFLRNVSSVSEA